MPFRVKIDRWQFGYAVSGELLAGSENRIGDVRRCLSAGGRVELDAEIAVRPTGVVARGKQESAVGASDADEVRRRRRREQAIPADDQMARACSGGHADDHLNCSVVVIAAVAAQNQRRARRQVQRVEHRLHKAFQVVRLLENRNLLAQAGRTHALVGESRTMHYTHVQSCGLSMYIMLAAVALCDGCPSTGRQKPLCYIQSHVGR